MGSVHRDRLERMRRGLAGKEIDAALVTDPDSIYYLTGYWGYLGVDFGRPTLLLLPVDGEAAILTPLMESEMAGRMVDVAAIVPWEDGKDGEWRGGLDRLLARARPKTLGVERHGIPRAIANHLADDHADLAQTDAAALVAAMRVVKDATEIETMRQAGQVAIAMTQAAEAVIGEDVAEYEIALAVIEGGTRRAAEFLEADRAPFHSPTIHNLQVMQSGHDTCMVHRRSTVRRIRRGDPVYLCFCGIANFKLYKLGFDRQYFVGTVSDEMARHYEAALAAQKVALDTIRPGAIAEDIHEAAAEAYREAGHAPGYRTGRAIGCSFLESPELKPGDRTPLQAGMTFAVDGGITVKGRFGTRVGDSIVVTEDGFDYLTPYPKDLRILD